MWNIHKNQLHQIFFSNEFINEFIVISRDKFGNIQQTQIHLECLNSVTLVHIEGILNLFVMTNFNNKKKKMKKFQT